MSVNTRNSIEDDLAAYLSSVPAAMSNPYPMFKRIRDTGPAYFHERGATYFLTSYPAVKAGLSNAGQLSNRGYADGTRAQAARARLEPDDRQLLDDVNGFELLMVSRSDG